MEPAAEIAMIFRQASHDGLREVAQAFGERLLFDEGRKLIAVREAEGCGEFAIGPLVFLSREQVDALAGFELPSLRSFLEARSAAAAGGNQ
jgi:hypothetical protein